MSSAQSTMPNSKKARALAREQQHRRSRRFFLLTVVGLVALFGVAIIMTRSEVGSKDPISQTREVTVSGQPIPWLAEPDDAIGMQIPEAEGTSFEGTPTVIEANGTPKMIAFLAHWCTHCQAEVPVLQSWFDSEGIPDGFEVISVSTSTDQAKPNYPPSEWLAREGWTAPVLVDDARSTLGETFGVNSYPFFVFVDAEGKVFHRVAGALSVEQIEGILAELR